MLASRSTLQANDLLDIVDFIKNEEKYTKRINELKAQEARLNEKMKIVNTLDKADALMQRNLTIEEKLAKDRAGLEIEFKARKQELEQEYQKKISAVEQERNKVASKTGELNRELALVRQEQMECVKQRNSIQEAWTNLNKKEMELHARDEEITRKVSAINQIMST